MIDDKTKKEILDTLKKEGLIVGEEMAVKVVKSAFALMKLLVPKAIPKISAIVTPILIIVEPEVLKLLDTIDGEDNPAY